MRIVPYSEYLASLPGVEKSGRNLAIPESCIPFVPSGVPLPIDWAGAAKQIKAKLPLPLLRGMYPYQQRAMLEAVARKRILFWLPGGSGKTLTSLYTALVWGLPCIISTRPDLKWEWAAQIKRWLPHKTVKVCKHPLDWQDPADFHIYGHNQVSALCEELPVRFSFIIDEPQRVLANESVVQYKQIDGVWQETLRRQEVSGLYHTGVAHRMVAHKASRLILQTATPIYTELSDLWLMLDSIQPGQWGKTANKFKIAYCGYLPGEYGLIPPDDSAIRAIPEDLLIRLQSCVFRVTTEETHKHLPKLRREVRYIPYNPGFVPPVNPTDEDADFRDSALNSLRKTDEVVSLCMRYDKVIVFTGERAVCDYLVLQICMAIPQEDKQTKVFSVHGTNTDPSDRVKIAEEYNKATRAILVCTPYSMGEGQNLQTTDAIIWAATPTQPGMLDQGEKRGHRIGMNRPLVVWFLIAEGTKDEDRKEKLIGRLLTDNSTNARQAQQDLFGVNNADLIRKAFEDML